MISGLIITLSAINQYYIVYQNDQLNSDFSLGDYDINSCNVPQLQKIYNEESLLGTLFIQNLTIKADEQFILQYQLSNLIDNDFIIESNQTDSSDLNNEKIIYISHVCPDNDELENNNYWGLLKVELTINNQTFDFYFESICSQIYETQKFDFSYLIIVITGVFFVFLTSRFGQIASLQIVNRRFQGVHINYLYFLLFVLTLIILLAFSFIALAIEIDLLALISYISNVFYIIDTCCFIKIHYWNHLSDYPFYILGWLLGSIPIITFFCLGFSWIINDVIFILNLGTYFKIFKVISFKDCLTIYVPFVIFNSLLNLAVYFRLEYGIEISNALNLTQFFSLQAPMFNYIPSRKCAFIEINTLFLPGLMIAYTVRYAKASKSFVYFIIYFLGLFLGLICWLATTFANSQYQITSLLFTIIPSSILAAILCYYRNELQIFYKGQFYDSILDDPFRINKDMKQSAKVDTELVSQSQQELPVINPSLFLGLTEL